MLHGCFVSFQPSTTKRGSGVDLLEEDDYNNANNNPLVSSDAGGKYTGNESDDDEDFYIPIIPALQKSDDK